MAEDHHFTLAGLRWLLRFTRLRGNADGWAYLPDPKKPTGPKKILVDSRLKGRRRLEVIVHECIHACLPQLSEDTVTETARDISRVLHTLGYRENQ